METENIKSKGRNDYNFKDTELQLLHELFCETEILLQNNETIKLKKDLVFLNLLNMELLNTKKRIDDIRIIILHIHSKYDLCGVCAKMLCRLSQTINYNPKNLLKDNPELCKNFEIHKTQFSY